MSGGFVVSGFARRACTKPNRGVICDAPPVSGSPVRRWLRGLRRDGVRDLRRACRKDLIFVTGKTMVARFAARRCEGFEAGLP